MARIFERCGGTNFNQKQDKMKLSTPKKPRHTRKWFTNRIGKDIVKNNEVSLINPPITIKNKIQAEMLYITQTQNNSTYSENIL